jgi:hypothetical protein
MSRDFGESLVRGMCAFPSGQILRLVRRPIINGRDQMLHWKSKLAYLLVAATVLAAFLGEAEGWHW